jgi:hypothetical protein
MVVAVPLLAGCVAGNKLPKGTSINGELGMVSLPQPVVGDRVYYANGRKERVTGVAGERVTWRRSKWTRYTASRDFTLPELAKQTRHKETSNRVTRSDEGLWPLTRERTASFNSERLSQERESGKQTRSAYDWFCKVEGAERIALAAGAFDTYRIACRRTGSLAKWKQTTYWYYSPRIEQPVLRIDYYPRKESKRLELVAFEPALSGVTESSRHDYQGHFQQTMERVGSGDTSRWQDPAGSASVAVRPLRTLQLRDGTYCRNYELDVSAGGSNRTGAGIVCRDPQGRWRVPKKIIN